ncbi:MAG: nitrilase-related carbon-nitrogen hydrolase, partial [Candidatus Binatia bacterium]
MSKFAIAQVQSSTDKTANLKQALRLIDKAKSQAAEIIAFPEFLMAFS